MGMERLVGCACTEDLCRLGQDRAVSGECLCGGTPFELRVDRQHRFGPERTARLGKVDLALQVSRTNAAERTGKTGISITQGLIQIKGFHRVAAQSSCILRIWCERASTRKGNEVCAIADGRRCLPWPARRGIVIK